MSTPSAVYEVFFTGKDDPRHGAIVIGEDTKPQFFRFETPEVYMGDTRTTVYRNEGEVVALLDWTAGSHLGLVSIATRTAPVPMTHLVMHGSTPNSRVFLSADNRQFEWRRYVDDPDSYDLWARSPVPQRIATYRRSNQDTPIGPSYAFLSYIFNNDPLLLEALIALCINRWIDRQGL